MMQMGMDGRFFRQHWKVQPYIVAVRYLHADRKATTL
jgi:hypothetical protein